MMHRNILYYYDVCVCLTMYALCHVCALLYIPEYRISFFWTIFCVILIQYDRNGIPFGLYSKGKLSPRSYSF